jgi:hypothetical protein
LESPFKPETEGFSTLEIESEEACAGMSKRSSTLPPGCPAANAPRAALIGGMELPRSTSGPA